MIRVLHFVHRLPPEYSGAAFQALRLVRALARQQVPGPIEGHVVAYAADPERCEVPEGVRASVVRLRSGLIGKLRQYDELRRVMARIEPDVVHVHGYHQPAVLFPHWAGLPIVLKTTLLGVDDLDSVRARGPLDALLADQVDRVIALTPALARACDPERTLVLPNGVDLQAFRPRRECEPVREELRRELGIAPADPLLLWVGGDSARKGFDELGTLWPRLRTALGGRGHLVVGGRFQGEGSTRDLETLPGVHLRPGMLDLTRWLPACDALLFLSRREGLPNAVLEALATDTLVVARDLPGTYEGLLDGSNSVLFEEPDGDALRRVAERLVGPGSAPVDNSALRASLSLEHVARTYATLYAELVAEGASARRREAA